MEDMEERKKELKGLSQYLIRDGKDNNNHLKIEIGNYIKWALLSKRFDPARLISDLEHLKDPINGVISDLKKMFPE
jgi:hypothetical protein